jgi:hypothetical protein
MIGITLWLLAAFKRFSARNTFQLGSVAFMAMTFFMKYSCAHPHYYWASGLTLLILDRNNKAEALPAFSPRWMQIALASTLVLHGCLFTWLHFQIVRAYDFPVGSQKKFCLGGVAESHCINLDPADATTPVPTLRLTAGHSYGWANSQFGHQFHVLTPPGKYVTMICNGAGRCWQEADDVSASKSLGLRIPFLVECSNPSSCTVIKGHPSDIGIGKDGLRIDMARYVSISHVE